ncbi:MAG: hypothetical protein IJ191_04085 [Treponema sp.]|nr:hypothetical protein [Treponema sp.]
MPVMTNACLADSQKVKKCFTAWVCGAICLCALYTEEPPALLAGIWDGTDRLVYFPAAHTASALDSVPAVVLKTYYGWYYDRAAEPESFAEHTERVRSIPTPRSAERLSVRYEPIVVPAFDDGAEPASGAWEIIVYSGQKELSRIPVAVIGTALYLDFVVRREEPTFPLAGDTALSLPDRLNGYWRGVSSQSAFRSAPLPVKENIYSYYIVDGSVYTIRYWRTDTPPEDGSATFTDETRHYAVPKRLVSAQTVYTCTTGRSTQIRNVEKAAALPGDYRIDPTGRICVFGAPYLTKLPVQTEAALLELVATANARRKPDPPPLLPPAAVDWHWDTIRQLEAGNALIEAVRKRYGRSASGE